MWHSADSLHQDNRGLFMKQVALLLAALALFVAGCSSPGEKIAEQILSNIDGVDGVDIDTDTGQIRIETPEGVASFGGGTLPSDLFVSFPDGYEIQSVVETPDGYMASVAYNGSGYDDIVTYFSNWTSSDSPDWEHSAITSDFNGETTRSDSWYMESRSIHVSDCFGIGSDSDSMDAVCVTVSSD